MNDPLSAQNPKIKRLIQCVKSKKSRSESACFVLENPAFIRDAITRFPDQVVEIYSCKPEQWIKHPHPVFPIDEKTLRLCSSHPGPAGTLALIKQPKPLTQLPTKGLSIVLDGIQIPSNIGAIIRNASAFSVQSIIVPKGNADPFHPESVRASAGTVVSAPFYFCDSPPDFPSGRRLFMSPSTGDNILSLPHAEHTILILGSEAQGPQSIYTPQKDDCLAHIPMPGNVDSLNVAVASGIALFCLSQNSNFSLS